METDQIVEEVTLPPAEWAELTLAPRLELGGRSAQEKIAGIISLGRPVTRAVGPDAVSDHQLRAFLVDQRRSSRFTLVHMVVSFRPGDQLLESVVVGLSLYHCEGSGVPPPIAWSLSPTKASMPATVVDKVGLTTKLGLATFDASQTSQFSKEEPVLVAVGERESDPEWRFAGSRQRPLVGVYSMSTVVQTPSGVKAFADLLVSATVRGALGLTRYRAEVEHGYSPLKL